MVFKKIFPVLLILILILFLFSCNQSDIGIFYGLEIEEKIIDNSLPNNLTVGGMVKTTDNSKLFIAAGRVYTKTSGSSADWVKVSSPSGYDLSTEIAATASDVYAVFFNSVSADSALFSMPAGGSSWTPVTGTFDGKVNKVKAVNNQIFVSTYISGSVPGKLYHSSDGTTFNPITGITAGGGHFDAAYYDDGTPYYWILTNKIIYKDDTANFSSTEAIAQPTLDSGDNFRNIYAGASGIFITTSDRRITASVDGSSWTTGDDIRFNINLNGMAVVTISGGSSYLLCGSDGKGYFEMTPPNPSNPDLSEPDSRSALSDNYSSATLLQNAVVLDIFVDGTAEDADFYALTATRGLWKNSRASSGVRLWSLE